MACFSFDTQNHNPDSNPNPNPERKLADVLCIFCYRRVFILNMDEILSDEDYEEGTSPKQPPVKRIFDFVKSGLPLGMGLLKCGNFLYMFGGEYRSDHPYYNLFPIKDSDPRFEHCERPMVIGLGIPEENPPCPVFSLDLTCDHSEPVPLRPMLGPKIYPIVERIGGQIYVLSDRLLSSSLPMFEVWNPMTEEWRALPNPPPFAEGSQIMCHCVCGRDIICAIGFTFLYRFSTVSETWECIEELSSREDMAMHGSFDVSNEDVYLGWCRETGWGIGNDTLWAMMDGPEPKDGYSVAVDSLKTRPHLPGFAKGDDAVLVNTSELGNYMCGLIPYVDWKGFLLYVFVFQVEKLESEKVSPSQAPLLIRYLRRQVYDFTYLKYRNEELPAHVFSKAVMGRLFHNTSSGRGECSREEAKRKRKEDDDDEEEEGQAIGVMV